MGGTTIKILSYNIHKGMNTGNRHFVLHAIRDALREVDADIVLLQEVHGHHSGRHKHIGDWPDNNQLEYIADDVWPFHVYGKNAIYRRGHHGNAILCKHPIDEWQNIDVSMMQKASRSLLHSVISLPDYPRKLHVICVHLGLFDYERKRQLIQLVEHIEAVIPHDEPLVIAGDFNDWRSKASSHLNTTLGFEEVFHQKIGNHARTFPSWMPMLKMDRVYVRCIEVVASEQLTGKPWQALSDHLPLLVELELCGS